MGHLLAAPDKFRGTASADEVATAAVEGARRAGWSCRRLPMADGGEGLLDALGGELRRTTVTGPLGSPVDARWILRADDRTAVIEMAEAAGLLLAGGPEGNDPVAATTAGVGELVLTAVEAGARRVVVGCGGSATTDGGLGAVRAVGDPARLRGAELVAAVDVTTPFLEAASVFGPQKGAGPDQVALLADRLRATAADYRRDFRVDVSGVPGSGAAGGLAGGLVALGGRVVPGFDLVAELLGLEQALQEADAVLTGEGRLDGSSFGGKVAGGVIRRAAPGRPVLCVAGSVDRDPGRGAVAALAALPPGVAVVDLTERFGQRRALHEVGPLVAEVVAEHLRRLGSPPPRG